MATWDAPERPRGATRPDVVLVEDDRQQADGPAAAGELFTGELFVRARAHARAAGARWYVLSAEYGLLAPDQVVGPYDRSLATVPAAYRDAWAPWTLARLEELAGPLRRQRIELHATTRAAAESLRRGLLAAGATVLEPLRGLAVNDRVAWYDRVDGPLSRPVAGAPGARSSDRADEDATRLADPIAAISPTGVLSSVEAALRGPGLYSWFVDEAGASQLSAGLGAPVAPGLVWVGQAGALRPGSSLSSTTTLRNQIAWVHLGRSVRLSPLRRILGAALVRVSEAYVTSEDALTDWMHAHLSVVTVGTDSPERLLERAETLSRQLAPQLSPERGAAPGLRRAVADARARFDGFPAQ